MSPTATTEPDAADGVVGDESDAATSARPPGRMARRQQRKRWIVRILAVVLVIFFLAQLRIHWSTITRVDAPFTMRSDNRLSIVSPGPLDEVELPMTVTWETSDYELADGEQFAVFLDKGFPSPRRDVRLNLCSEQGKQPPQPGELRAPCKDDRESIFFTTDTSMSFDCFEPRFQAGRRRQHEHTVSVILVDEELKRIGETAAAVTFRVDSDDADACRGF